MKIGISVAPVYNIKREMKNIDGIGTYTSNLCQELGRQNIHVEEIYFKKLGELWINSSAPQGFHLANHPVLSLLPGHYYGNLHSKLNLLHVTDYLVPRVKGIPIISTVHDAIMLKHSGRLGKFETVKRLKGQILKRLSNNADHFITCSQTSADAMVDIWKIPENKISIISYGLSPIWNQRVDFLDQQNILKKYQLTKPFILSVGTLQPRKNINRVIDAYLSLPKTMTENFDLVLVGKVHSNLTPSSLLEKVKSLNKSKRIIWLEYVPLSDLRCLYQSAHVLLYPSLMEGFGFPILEGFASATSVITSQGGATAEIAGEAAYLVDPYSEVDIAEGMMKFIENPEIHQQFIKRGLSRVKKFSWEECARQTIQIYEKFL